VLVNGLGASPGVVSGAVRIVHKLDHLDQVQEGDVMVTEMTMPDMVPAMKRAAGIITDEGGMTSHAAIISGTWRSGRRRHRKWDPGPERRTERHA